MRRDARLETREARSRLKARPDPYWKRIDPGLSLGYRRNKSGGVWVARKFEGGKYTKQGLGAADDHDDANGANVLSYKEALRIALAIADRREALAQAGIEVDYTVKDALADYMEWYREHRKGSHKVQPTVDRHILKSRLAPRRVSDLTTKEIRAWHQGLARGRSKSTANRILVILRAALNRAWEDGYAPSADAWRRVKPFRGADTSRERHLSEDECRRLINACEADFRQLVRGALLTGCRLGELRTLRCADYQEDAGTVTIRESKSGKARHVPLTDEGVALFEELVTGKTGGAHVFTNMAGNPWGEHHQVRRIREASKRAKIDPPANFHALRHTYGSLLAMKGVPLHVIAEAMGHADTRMTSQHYAHLQPSYVADTIRAHLPSFDGKKTNIKRLRR